MVVKKVCRQKVYDSDLGSMFVGGQHRLDTRKIYDMGRLWMLRTSH